MLSVYPFFLQRSSGLFQVAAGRELVTEVDQYRRYAPPGILGEPGLQILIRVNAETALAVIA